MRRLAIFTIIGILALAGCGDSSDSGDSAGSISVSMAGPGICDRTPEIQNRIISDMDIPSCMLINETELYRVREISFDTESIKPDDLDGFVNLKTLRISGLNEPMTPDIFTGLKSLTSLHIDMKLLEEEKTEAFGAKAFKEMPKLEQLKIQNRSEKPPLLFGENAFQGINDLKVLDVNGYASIERGTFKKSGKIDKIMFESLESMPIGGLDGLNVKTLDVRKIKRIFPGSLNGVQGIRYLKISADSSNDTKPRIARSLFSELEELRAVSMYGFKWPEEIELNNLEVVCEIKSQASNNWEPKVIIIVDGEKVEYLTTQKIGENKKICKVVIGDQIKEILITHDEE